MDFDFNIAGITVGFQVFPDATSSFYDQFYDGSKDDWKLAIQRINNEISYTYLRYNLFSGENRGGSFIGFSLIFKDVYCINVQRLLKLFNAVYEGQLQEKKLIGYNDGGKPKFLVTDLKTASPQIALLKQVFKANLIEHFVGDFKRIDATFLQSDLSKAYKVGSDISEKELLDKFQKYAFVEISSSRLTKGEERVITEKDLFTLEHLPEKIIEKSKSFIQRWQDISTQMGTLSQLPQNRQNEKKPILYSLFSNLKNEIDDPFMFLATEFKTAKTNIISNPTHILYNAYFQKLVRQIDIEKQAVNGIKNSMLNVEDVIDTYKTPVPTKSNSGDSKANFKVKKIVIIASIIFLLLGGLYYFFPKQNKENEDPIKDPLVKEKIKPEQPLEQTSTQISTNDQLYNKYIGLAGEDMKRQNFRKAIERLDSALFFKPSDPLALSIKDTATRAIRQLNPPKVRTKKPPMAIKERQTKKDVPITPQKDKPKITTQHNSKVKTG